MTSTDTSQNTDHLFGLNPYQASKGEEYMNDAQVAHFREILNRWKAELQADISRTVHSMQDSNINLPDPNDRASIETDMALELRSRDRERKLIKKIDEALSWLEDDEYGFCTRCGEEIGIQRLEARPTASLCVDCKQLEEIRERQMV
jgi:DnaK suppressor protein